MPARAQRVQLRPSVCGGRTGLPPREDVAQVRGAVPLYPLLDGEGCLDAEESAAPPLVEPAGGGRAAARLQGCVRSGIACGDSRCEGSRGQHLSASYVTFSGSAGGERGGSRGVHDARGMSGGDEVTRIAGNMCLAVSAPLLRAR